MFGTLLVPWGSQGGTWGQGVGRMGTTGETGRSPAAVWGALGTAGHLSPLSIGHARSPGSKGRFVTPQDTQSSAPAGMWPRRPSAVPGASPLGTRGSCCGHARGHGDTRALPRHPHLPSLAGWEGRAWPARHRWQQGAERRPREWPWPRPGQGTPLLRGCSLAHGGPTPVGSAPTPHGPPNPQPWPVQAEPLSCLPFSHRVLTAFVPAPAVPYR